MSNGSVKIRFSFLHIQFNFKAIFLVFVADYEIRQNNNVTFTNAVDLDYT